MARRTKLSQGHRKGEPLRCVPGHHGGDRNAPRPKPDREYGIDERTGCWAWERGKNVSGYVRARRNGRMVMAHRAIYEEHRGPIPAGMVLDHLCRNPSRVNPDRLEPVTNAVNAQRGAMAKLTPERVREIRSLAGTASFVTLARRFGVGASTIDAIIHREHWRNV